MKNECIPCISTIMLLLVMALCVCWKTSDQRSTYDQEYERQLIEMANANGTWKISSQKAVRKGNYSQIDATDQLIYFAYSRSSCVDAYNHQGEFQYAFLFPVRQNGSVQIKCVDQYLYVSDKYNNVYVFDGVEEISYMEAKQAIQNGYNYFWFEEKKPIQENNGSFYIEKDCTGEIVRKIALPDMKSNINWVRVGIMGMAVLVYIYIMLSSLIQKHSLP